MTLHLRFARGRVLAGFMEGRSHRLIDLDRCPVLCPDLAKAPAIARDPAIFVEDGYRIERVTPVDQFKYAARAETVAVLRR